MSVKDGRQKSTAARPSSKAVKPNSPVGLKRQPWTASNERKASPSTDGKKASLQSIQSVLARNSVASSKSSLRSSTSSCHDACKFGGHGASADCNAGAKFGSKPPARIASKVGAAKLSKPAISKIAVVQSPVRSRISDSVLKKSVAKTPRESLSSVNGRDQSSVNRPVQNAVHSRAQTSVSSRASNSVSTRAPNSVNSRVQNSVNSRAHHSVNSRESFKPSRAVTSTPEGKFKVSRSLFRSPPVPKKILGSKVSDNNKDSMKWQSPVARSLLAAFESPSGDLLLSQAFEEYNCHILDDQAEEEFFRQYYSPTEPENAAHCVVNNRVHSSGGSEISFEAFSGDPFSEISSPGSLDAYADDMYRVNNSNNSAANMKMRFRRESGGIRDSEYPTPETQNVVLRRQNTQGRKASEDYLIDHVIEEAVNKLSHREESKVKVLVGAFETVISLRDSHDAAAADHTRPLQTCN
ncbi:hypothetical protein SUGI_0998760 [Cryptomeria japonica]|uniref:uncharacterized protein LOC131072611 n=1 Tax=Cryptomeria japonica TaxID=3369 RepID=UPI002414A743|nr:uncharacterized protein LOC131072611 [Cryptomeria japonica]GLJ47299.1 hypothetical protein SUGI_0998760 [Cryptomeria japonica]